MMPVPKKPFSVLCSYSFLCLTCLALFACSSDKDASEETKETTTALAEPQKAPETPKITQPVAPSMDSLALQDSLQQDSLPVKVERPSRKPAAFDFEHTSYFYDTINQGDIIEHDFVFTNVGERPLSIKDVQGSCGCTIGSYPFLDIAPQEKSQIKARFDSKGKVGPQFTTITVYSNANPKGVVLSLKGVVRAPAEEATTAPQE